MFDQLRRNTKLILWITVVAFIGLGFLGWGLSSGFGGKAKIAPGTIGLVNGKPIDGRAYDLVVQRERENYKQQAGRDPDERTEIQMRTQAWNDLVQEMILRQEADRRKIRVTDTEIVEAVFSQPPQEFTQSPAFQTNGKFDQAKYRAYLQDPNTPTQMLEEQYRQNLPLQKLQMMVAGTVSVSNSELWDAFQAQNERIKVEYLMIPGSKFQIDASTLSQADIEAYYQAHRQSYQAPAQAVLQFVSIPIRPTQNDSLNLVEQARGILQEYRNGEDFLLLVSDFSEAPLQLLGGDAGTYLTASQIADPDVRAAAFSIGVGEVSGVLGGTTGVHVIKVLDRKVDPAGEQVKYADIFLPLRPSGDTYGQIRDTISQFRQDTAKRPFEQVASEMQLPVRETAPFGDGGFIPGLGSAPDLQAFAFKAAPGTVSAPTELPDGWVVARLKERREPGIPDLAQILDRVRTEAADSMRVTQAAQMAQGLVSQAQAGTPLASLARPDGSVVFDTTEPFARMGFPKGIGADPAVIGPLFAGGEGVQHEVLRGRTSAFVVKVVQRIPADRDAFQSQKESLRKALMQRRQNQVFTEWLATLKKQAEVKDYRFGQIDG
jgi:parvulin-like peptidyl-prolyl isomerase